MTLMSLSLAMLENYLTKKISMIKKQTGVVYSVEEFKNLNQCVNCGKANKHT